MGNSHLRKLPLSSLVLRIESEVKMTRTDPQLVRSVPAAIDSDWSNPSFLAQWGKNSGCVFFLWGIPEMGMGQN